MSFTCVIPLPSVIVLLPGDSTGKRLGVSTIEPFLLVVPLYASIASQSMVVGDAVMAIATPFTVSVPVPVATISGFASNCVGLEIVKLDVLVVTV